MATPSSSATSPSPPMPYLLPGAGSQQASTSTISDHSLERENKQKAVQKFLARAEIAMVTRALRARLAYASYKAQHNIPHVPLRDLEAQSQSQTASFNRTIAAKRKAVGATNYYNNPATQGPSTSGAGSLRRGGSGTMPPPASVSSPRTHASSGLGYSTYGEVASSLRHSSQAPNLYSSILAPPPTKHARTVHNPSDPPVPAPSRPAQSPRSRAPKPSPRSEAVRPQAKAKQASKSAKVVASPGRRRTKGGSIDKGKQKQRADDMDVDVDGDVDMKAAATLTSLLMHHKRPSITGSASSPRSSIDGSEVGSAYSYFAQSSTRTSGLNPAAPLSVAPSSSTIIAEPPMRSQTPPPSSGSSIKQHTTPRAAPTDSEAANLMLFLATSPSPLRPANKEAKDLAAYRALGGGSGPLRSKGRVLFPSTPATDPTPSGHQDVSASTGASYKPPALSRGGENSFTSSISSIGAELGGTMDESSDGQPATTNTGNAVPSSSIGSAPSQLLPSAPLPLPSAPSSPSGRKDPNLNPKATLLGVPGGSNHAPPLDFNFHEFINASPSPSRGTHGHGINVHNKTNLGLRADVGRKLFEEEQMRQAHAFQVAAAAAAIGSPGHRQEERPLGAGIDLIQS